MLQVVLSALRSTRISVLSVISLLLFSLPAEANFKTLTVQAGVETETVLAFSLTGCTPVTPTNGTITVQPKHGTVVIVGGSYTTPGCPNVQFPGVQANYTWTDTSAKPGSGSDAFHVRFTSVEGTVDYDILISVGIDNEENGPGGPPVPTFPSCDTCPFTMAGDASGDSPADPADASQSLGMNGQVMAGAPINIGTGNMFYSVTDYRTAGQNPLSFSRYYNSGATATGFAATMGPNWRSNYDRYIEILTPSIVAVERPTGQILGFFFNGSAWVTNTDVDYTLTNTGNTWTLKGPDDTVESYSQVVFGTLLTNVANLTSIKARDGYAQNLSYNGNELLQSVTDSYGRALTFSYTNGLLSGMTTPENNTFQYIYNSNKTLEFAISPLDQNGGYTHNYFYENASLPTALTGVADRYGERLNTWSYDSQGRAITSSQGGTAINANLTNVAYNTDGTVTVTNPLGVADTYTFTTLHSGPKVTGINRAATSTTASSMRSFTYDANGYLASQTDWNGIETSYVNSVHGLPTTISEAVGKPEARTATISYNATFVHLPASIVKPGVTATFTYDASGNMLTRTLTDTTTTTVPYSTKGQVRTWTFTYDATGHTLTVKNPRTDATITTTYSYDSTGALTAITNALGQSLTVTSRAAGGFPLSVTDPNGVVTALSYDSQMRLTNSAITTGAGVLTTTYNYWFDRFISSIVQPGGSVINTIPDTAQRLANIIDGFHNTVSFTLDALGNRTQINTFDPNKNLTRQHSATFDALGRMLTDIGGMGQTTTFTLDNNGNALTITDPLGHKTTNVFDSLNRLTKSTDANGGIIQFSYDTHDRPLTAVDANGNTTAFIYDGFGDMLQQSSPDSGVTVYHYDLDGNLTSKTDATGVITNLTYDKLDRVITTTYPADTTLNVAYTYDQSGHGFGIGHLTSLTDAAGSLSRTYDERGNLLSEQRTAGNAQLTTSYTYDAAGRTASITYPSGAVSSFTRDGMGYVTQMPFSATNSDQSFSLWNMTHLPFGPVNFIYYNNGDRTTFSYDQDYRLTNLAADAWPGTTSFINWTYNYDAADNISSITDSVTAANSQSFAYDLLNRLTGATSSGTYGNMVWAYDKNGNLTSRTAAGVPTNYTYTTGTNRLAGATWPSNTETFSYTPTGNISGMTQNGSAIFTGGYSKANRLVSVTGTPLAISSIVYDAFGKRFSKGSSGSIPTTYIYDQDGNLIEENDNGNIIDYLYFDGINIANWEPGEKHLYMINTDRLGTPLVSRDGFGLTNWAAFSQPYGAMTQTVASGQFTGPVTQNLRLPGQYFDAESGLHYNGFRDYIPGLGRYLESDPIGLLSGMNPYQYGDGTPLAAIDPRGLATDDTQNNAWINGHSYRRAMDGPFQMSNCYGVSLTGEDNAGFDSKYGLVDRILQYDYDVFVSPQQIRIGDIIMYYNSTGHLSHSQRVIGFTPTGEPIVHTRDGEFDWGSIIWPPSWKFGPIYEGAASKDPMANGDTLFYHPKSPMCPCNR